MVVDGGNVDTTLNQLGHYRVYLALQQHEVAHHHGHVTHRLERSPAAESECRADRHAVKRHLQVGTGKAVAMDGTANRACSAENAVDLGPVDCLRVSDDGRRQYGAARCENP